MRVLCPDHLVLVHLVILIIFGTALLIYNQTCPGSLAMILMLSLMMAEPKIVGLSISNLGICTPFVGNVVMRRKPQSIFCVSVRLWPHSGIHIWVPFSGPGGH
jgi:hypothetical protein